MSSSINPLFRLTAITLICAMLVPVTTTRAGPNCNDPKHSEHPACSGGGEDGVVYTAELTTGVFPFGPVNVTPDADENTLLLDPPVALDFVRPGPGAARDAWDAVWAECPNLLGPTPVVVPSITVVAGNTEIKNPGGVFAGFVKIPLLDTIGDPIEITLTLLGDEFDPADPDKQFVPAAGDTSTFTLGSFWIIGKTAKGVHPKRGCVHGGSAPLKPFDPGFAITLVITATPI